MIDISRWPLGKIMQLPDHAFGTKFPIHTNTRGENGNYAWDISEVAMPDMIMIWFLEQRWYYATSVYPILRIAWGDQMPTTHAEFMELETVFNGLGYPGPEPRARGGHFQGPGSYIPMRKPVEVNGRRLVQESYAEGEKKGWCETTLIVSHIPKAVGEWILLVPHTSP